MSFEPILKFLLMGLFPILVVLFFFGLTIFAHEWGHYLMARRRGMIVERFSIFGMGPPIVKWKRKEVEYCICWIPIGAYVQIPQMAPMEALEGATKQKAAELPPATPVSKILVALAGPVMNIIFAVLLASVLWVLGAPEQTTIVGWVEKGSNEELAGIQPGDRVVQINKQKVRTWTEMVEAVAFSRQSTVQVVVERAGQRHTCSLEARMHDKLKVKTLDIYPREKPYVQRLLPGQVAEKAGIRVGDRLLAIEDTPVFSRDQIISIIEKRADKPTQLRLLREGQTLELSVTPEAQEKDKGRIGVWLGEETVVVRPGPTPLAQFGDILKSMGRMVRALVHHKETGVGVNSMAGPIGISYMWWVAIVSGGLLMGLKIGVLLNLNLAILNLLPIPVLDGGHIVFGIAEMIRRRPLNAKFVERTQTAFAILLLSFMLYITIFGDIRRFLPDRPKPDKTAPAAPAQPAPTP